ncbi:MAG: D-tyrosyl-tRNA(Tyr) deacylase [Bacteroidales bacterium]|nr:D-tyrosyl-tRNA(Tyr) deacylase [Bacteroidales bacterium]
MRTIIQRVNKAEVTISGDLKSHINKGLLILLGIEDSDNMEDVDWLTGKIARLRIFDDTAGVMNLSVMDIQGEILVVSQFTLHASTKKGNRPSYIRASKPEKSIPLYEAFIMKMGEESGLKVATGEFGAMMQVSLVNNGPVTIFIDSKNKE